MQRRRLLAAAAGLAALARPGLLSAAINYPARPVRIISPFPPGGAVDAVSRKLAQRLTQQLGGQVFVENKTGATGTIGIGEAARAPADGYTLFGMDSTYAMLPSVFKRLSWDHARAFTPITDGAWMPVVLVVRADAPFASFQALVEAARKEPEKISYGSGGIGSVLHLYAEALQQATNTKLFHVPYRGAGEVMTALLSGQVQLAVAPTAATVEHVRSGTMRALALGGPGRSSAMPQVPTFAELGLPQFSPVYRTGLGTPAGTPEEIVRLIQSEVAKSMVTDDMKEFLAAQVAEPGGSTPEEFARVLREETALWSTVAERAGIEKQ
ncbi:Bug family tripartite tricarboxylate transporter substrate binding protein [Roseicella frigidaeris]|nr:tripartite tricarboxylate transporter substrate binding protein [Roseicella frigidaeris]